MHALFRRIGIALLFVATVLVTRSEAADQKQHLEFGGLTRSYVVRAPELDRNGARVPLVIVLHGGGGNAENAENMTGFTDKARKEGFVVVYPDGTGMFRNRLLTWNSGHCCGHGMKKDVDDVGFINFLIDALAIKYPIDPNQIFITGMSNGGMMTHRLGIELSSRIAAIAPVVATVFGDEKMPAVPVSALMINGMLDKNVPPAGGEPGGRGSDAWDGTSTLPTEKQSEFWAKADGCKDEPQKDDSGTAVHWQYRCPSGRSVELLLVKDNGHAWPGGKPGSRRGDKPSTAQNATDLIWDFFKSHPKNASAAD
jgi:polyhydroxybutyrate depolymerase